MMSERHCREIAYDGQIYDVTTKVLILVSEQALFAHTRY